MMNVSRLSVVFTLNSKNEAARFHRPLECGLRSHNAGFVPLRIKKWKKLNTSMWTLIDGNRNKQSAMTQQTCFSATL